MEPSPNPTAVSLPLGAQLCTTKAQELKGLRGLKSTQKKAELYVPRMGWFSFRFLDVVVGFTSLNFNKYLVEMDPTLYH